MILTKLALLKNWDSSELRYNYGYTFHIKGPSLVLKTKIWELIRSGRCFTFEELEKQRKMKGKIIEKLANDDLVNKSLSEEKSI